jgi:branched-chain amino acid transport system ATP-binding protein
MPSPVLETRGLSKAFGMVTAAADIDVRLEAGELAGIAGANGSGKTTFLNLISGYLRPDAGTIRFLGRDITGLAPRVIVGLGIARSFQIPQLYASLEVIDNVLLTFAAHAGSGLSAWGHLHRPEWTGKAAALLERFGLAQYARRPVVELPAGARKLLDVALSIALQPQLLLLDEPTSGVSSEDKFEVMERVLAVLRAEGVTTILVEHDVELLQRYAKRVLVFNAGQVIADGAPAEVLAQPEVRLTLLGHL